MRTSIVGGAAAIGALVLLGAGGCVGTLGPDVDGVEAADGGGSGDPSAQDAAVSGGSSGNVAGADGSTVGPGADGGNGADAGTRDGGKVGCAIAGTSDWYTYGHDAMRTSASDGCMMGPLSVTWTFKPTQPQGGSLTDVENAIVTKAAVYLKSAASNNGAQTAAIVDKLSPSGAPSWRWSFGDFEEHQWPTFAFGKLLVEEDTFWLVDDASGHATQVNEYDDWGTNTADDKRWYLSSDVNSKDSSIGVYVGGYLPDPSATPFPHSLWMKDQFAKPTCGFEVNNSIAVEGGVVFQAGEYRALGGPAPLSSGVHSFDGANGTARWTQMTLPRSSISAGAGMVFLIEQDAALLLVARKQADGAIAWSKKVSAASVQAPVLAGGLVIVAEADGIDAYDPASGQLIWAAPGIDAVRGPYVATIDPYFDSCGGSDVLSTPSDTSLVAATGSNTLVVTAKDKVHILSLANGSEVWSGSIAGVTGPLKNPVVVGKTLYAVDKGANGGIGQLVALTSP